MANKECIDILMLKPVFHGACFGAVSAPTLYAPYPRRVRPNPARIRRVQSRRRNRSKTRSMENGPTILHNTQIQFVEKINITRSKTFFHTKQTAY